MLVVAPNGVGQCNKMKRPLSRMGRNYFSSMLLGQAILLRSDLDSASCWRRLEEATKRETFIPQYYRERTVIARIKKPQIRLRLEPSGTHISFPNSYNSFSPCFYGRIEATPTGSSIVGQLRFHSWVYFFLVFWYAIWFFLFGPTLLDAWRQMQGLENKLRVSSSEVILAALFALAPWLISILGYNHAAEQRVFLFDFIKQTFSATEYPMERP